MTKEVKMYRCTNPLCVDYEAELTAVVIRYHQEALHVSCMTCGAHLGQEPTNFHQLPVVRAPEYDRPYPSGRSWSAENRLLLEAKTGFQRMADPELGNNKSPESVQVVERVGQLDEVPARQVHSGVRGLHPANSNRDKPKLDQAVNSESHWSDMVEVARLRRRIRSGPAIKPESWSQTRWDNLVREVTFGGRQGS